ncbi:glycoside hydrolase family 97 C-terminal domain-containing protein [Haliscomenobacter sp.]|uniref:glycoside hydrolase family 97 C-terminal domain-containing protein n=1 Tax=Haliscomenobacter sp. TaxID=2717303 RepID=UPI003594747E
MELLGSFPTTWHETRVLQAQLGDHLVLARRHGKRWYLAAINDWTPYETVVKLDFLPRGKTYRATICADGVNAQRFGSDYVLRELERKVKAGDALPIKLAPGGGWVMVLVLEE